MRKTQNSYLFFFKLGLKLTAKLVTKISVLEPLCLTILFDAIRIIVKLL